MVWQIFEQVSEGWNKRDKPTKQRIVGLFLISAVVVVTLIIVAVAIDGNNGTNQQISAASLSSTSAPTSPSPAPTTSQPSPSPTTSQPSPSPTTSQPSSSPTTSMPSSTPTEYPTLTPTATPSSFPTSTPSVEPTDYPSVEPTTSSPSTEPSPAPTGNPSVEPTGRPTITPGPTMIPETYQPGNLTTVQHGLLLSEGLEARIIAQTNQTVDYDVILDVFGNVASSAPLEFHGRPDFGATFVDERSWNEGGWIYVSNSEMEQQGLGGVGAITFNKYGQLLNYKMVLENTTMNCGGGRTPWNTWVSCEEIEFTGQIYQVDPYGERQGELMTLGYVGGRWESFAYDVRDKDRPKFFATEDHNKGTVRRFIPNEKVDWTESADPWQILHDDGVVDYLLVTPNAERTGGTFEWTDDFEAAKNNARSFYPQSEGIDVYENLMFVVCKRIKQMFTFDLDTLTYTNRTTVSGLFDGGPDQMQRILHTPSSKELLYFTEEGGKDAGIHARDQEGRFFTILESPVYIDETTGLAFSPNGKHMYVAYQANGILFDVWRKDGLPFQARTLNVKYHQDASM